MNRKRVLWPLLLAAAFGLGVLAAQVQAGAIFLPLVARASPGQETPTPPPSGTVIVESVHYYRYLLTYHFYGELVNDTDCTVSVGRVTLYLLDADGLPITNKTACPMAPILSPGERTPFQIYWYGPVYDPRPAWDSYVVQVDWDPIDRLTLESAVLTPGKYPSWLVIAELRNQLPVSVQASVGAVLYGPSGEIIGYHDPLELQEPLLPGATVTVMRTFTLFEWDASIEPEACAAFAIPSGGSCLPLMDQAQEQEAIGQ